MNYLNSVHGKSDLDFDGYIVLTRGIGADPNDHNGENFRRFRQTPIVRLNYGYFPDGTIPRPAKYTDFAQRCANFVEASPGCSRWIIGNEPNHGQERPDGQPILPSMYAECFTECRDAIRSLQFHTGDQVLVAAVAPWNVQTKYPGNESGDWIRYFEDVQAELRIAGCDGFAIHTYCREQTPSSVANLDRMDPPFEMYHNGFRTYADWMHAILPRFQGLPVYCTEFCVAGVPWRDVNTGCVQQGYLEVDQWNRLHAGQQIEALTMYRWEHDQWEFKNKPNVQADFNEAVARGYTVPPGGNPEPPEEDVMQNPSLELPYFRDAQNSTVEVAHDWTYFASDGKPPERDGPCQLPEYKALNRSEDPRRVYDGNTAQCWFIRWKIMDAGIYQRIPAEVGASYTFDAMCQAWCSDSDDPAVSDGDMHVMLGIDPAGNTDPWAQSVVWTDWRRVGAEYKLYTTSAIQAQAGHITVFVRAWNKWELSHNDVYLDDCHLVKQGGGQPPGGGCNLSLEDIRRVMREELEHRSPVVWPLQL